MASTYTNSLRLEIQAAGENNTTWGQKASTVFQLLEAAITDYQSISISDANYTLTTNNGSTDEARSAFIKITGSLSAQRNIIVPTQKKLWLFTNGTTGSQNIQVKTSAGTGIVIGPGLTRWVACDGTNVIDAITDLPAGTTLAGTAIQASNANLTALAGQTGAANKLSYWTGAGALSLTDLTSFGRSLIDDADASAGRTTLGLVIGTDVQAYNANLAALAGQTGAANKLSYWTGAGALSLADLTSFARTILDDADAATVRGTIGVGSMATRAVTISTSAPSGGSDGDVWLKY